ncbi:MAG: LacI family DNA-binding transcriptional regulator [Bacteroidota bacterium]|nr:LacI family DNA-binding transcriptional regulator [Bacteroidota bacterium]
MAGKINIKELAKYLNLSIATVSKALRDSYEISEQTKKKVLEAAEKLNYTPNPHASSLRKRKSKTIAVILPEVADNFFSLAINGIQSIAGDKGYHLLIYLSHEKFENEKAIVEECKSGRVDGVLISISSETTDAEHIKKLQAENIPVVFFDREFENIKAAKVITNDYECGQAAAEHLLKNGSKHPVFLSISSSLPICNKRAEGFSSVLINHGIFHKDSILYCDVDTEKMRKQIKKIISKESGIDAIVTSVERVAMQVYLTCHEKNIKIPEDLKVIAFSTLETAPILSPPLTTITQPAFEIGKKAAEILFKSIEKSNYDLASDLIIIPSKLIERTSTKKVRNKQSA